MSKEIPKEIQSTQKSKVDAQAFMQRKLQILNAKSGARYERDAARVVSQHLPK